MIELQQYKHYNKDIEKSVVGSCLLDANCITRTIGLVKPEYFYDLRNEFVYKRLFEMWQGSMPIDMLTFCQNADHKKWASLCPDNLAWYIVELTKNVVSTLNIETHCLIVRELYANRKIIEIKSGADSDNSISALELIKDQIDDIFRVNVSDDWQSIDQVLVNKLVKHMDEVKGRDVLGAKTGFATLDKMTSGLQDGQLVVVGARPSVGKSSFAGTIANSSANQGLSVGIITLEMPNEQLGARLLSMESGVDFWRIWRNKMSDEQFEDVMMHMSRMSELKIYFSDKSAVSITNIKSKAEKLKKRNGLDLLIIDYLQLIEGDDKKGSTREREVAKMSLGCKRMAMEMKIPVILLAQLNRGSETVGGDKKPRLHNLRESGAIEQDADVVIMIHRDRVAEQEQQGQGNFGPYDASLIIEKNRNGACGEIPIKFDAEKMRFFEEGKLASINQPSKVNITF